MHRCVGFSQPELAETAREPCGPVSASSQRMVFISLVGLLAPALGEFGVICNEAHLHRKKKKVYHSFN